MSTDNGWIKLWRKILHHPLFQDKPFNNLSAWIDLLLQTSFSELATVTYIRNTPVSLRKGQIATSLSKLSERWGTEKWTRKKVSGFLRRLQSEGMISFTTNNLATTITITKWREYQDPYMRNGTPKVTQREHGISETPAGREFSDAKKVKEEEEKKFKIFWDAYPNKQGKADSKRAWMKLNIEDEIFTIIMKSLTKQKTWSQWCRNNGQFIPMPATWIRGERWNDESLEASYDDKWVSYF